MANNMIADLMASVRKADGGLAMSIEEFKEAQFGLPLKHYCLQYLFGSTGLRYGGFYLLAGKPKSCKSPFAFFLAHLCCENEGLAFIYEMEGKASPTLLESMFADHPEWRGIPDQETMRCALIPAKTMEVGEKHTSSVIKVYKNKKAYANPLLIDWDSISGAGTEDIAEKIEGGEAVGKGYGAKPHIMKNFTENWVAVRDMLPIVFVGVLQEKQKISETGRSAFAAPQKSYSGGDSQLFKAATLLSFAQIGQLPVGNGKILRIKTELNGFADARQIEVKFVWDQFGSLETESQGHKWLFAEATARCLATPKIVGNLRDIIDVKMNDQGLVTCKQFGLDKVTPEEFETALFAPENDATLEDLYKYHKIEKIKLPSEYPDFVARRGDTATAAKEAEKEEKKAAQEARIAEEKAKEAAKQEKREAKARKAAAASSLKALKEMAKGGTNANSDSDQAHDA